MTVLEIPMVQKASFLITSRGARWESGASALTVKPYSDVAPYESLVHGDELSASQECLRCMENADPLMLVW